VRRVRREAYFHRDNDRKLGGGIQGLECCELWRGLGAAEEVSGGGSRAGGEVKTRTLHKTKGSAPREFQSWVEQTPVPRGRAGHPPEGRSFRGWGNFGRSFEGGAGRRKPHPSYGEGFGTPRVLVVLEANCGAARKDRRHAPVLFRTSANMQLVNWLAQEPPDTYNPGAFSSKGQAESR
jgi:hypothetical protein